MIFDMLRGFWSKWLTQTTLGRRGEHLVFIQFVLMIGFVLLPIWHPGLSATTWEQTALWRWLITAPLLLIAMTFSLLGMHSIRDYLTPLPYPVDHSQLVQHGIYSRVRHPLYASLLFLGLAWISYYLSLSHFILWWLIFAFFDYKANKEEAWLIERHPDYQAYAARVSKFIPWIY
jgi:protein-S-isoprenylcysteine O-methyltransferase Ste14